MLEYHHGTQKLDKAALTADGLPSFSWSQGIKLEDRDADTLRQRMLRCYEANFSKTICQKALVQLQKLQTFEQLERAGQTAGFSIYAPLEKKHI